MFSTQAFSVFDVANQLINYIADIWLVITFSAVAWVILREFLAAGATDQKLFIPRDRNESENLSHTIPEVKCEPVDQTQAQTSQMKCEPCTSEWQNKDISSLGIRGIRAYVREHNLQSAIREQLGKSVSSCSLRELREALA